MSSLASLGIYLPPWGTEKARVPGLDEDALTMAVEAGLAARSASDLEITKVIFISRDLPLLVGGNTAPLLGGLGLANTTEAIEQIGGAPAVLDAIATASPGTLVLTADVAGGAGAGAALIGPGDDIVSKGRVHRSLPLQAEGRDGILHDDDDPRLQRERGARFSLTALDLASKPFVVAGLGARDAASFAAPGAPTLAVTGAASAIFGLAAAVEAGGANVVVAVEQATASAVEVTASITPIRVESAPQAPEKRTLNDGPEIKIAFTAYDRAFESKVRCEAGECPSCKTLALPQRYRCFECGEEGTSVLVPLPRTASIYTQTTIRVAVPGLATPYSLCVAEMDGIGVRSLVTVTDAPAASAAIGESGRMVLRRVATRAGVPDYGYAFSPEGRVSRPAPLNLGGVR